ncbi:DUF2784 family protein [candidate division GN15 bacterium]|nr:DUF2784 family protein [candidate division GN15 bacterium]
MQSILADLLLVIHVLWVVWMVSGVVIALLGFVRPKLWGLTIFRITHLVGMALTASTPIWSDGICPLTIWEYQLREGADNPRSLLSRIFHDLIYWDVPLIYLSLLSAAAALITVVLFILRPPWKSY